MTSHGRYVLRLADTNLVLAQRLGEWVGHAPALEEDLGLANVSDTVTLLPVDTFRVSAGLQWDLLP